MSRSFAPTLLTVLAVGVLGGCSASDPGSDGAASADRQAAVVTTTLGVFALVPNAPPGFGDLAGTAELVDGSDGGSGVSLTLSGLKPNVGYVAHVHAGTCDQADAGGPHFKFDLDGPDTPPNEIHLDFTANATRHASAQTHSAMRVPKGAAGSIVVHQATASSGAGSADDAPKAAAGHEQHATGSGGGTANAAGGHTHSHAAKIACAALRERDQTDAASSTPPLTARPAQDGALTIRVTNKEPVGGVQKLTVRKGDRVRFTVTADQPEEVHVHGYDVTKSVGPAAPARFDFPAEIEGIFEVELEGAGAQILSLTVNPK